MKPQVQSQHKPHPVSSSLLPIHLLIFPPPAPAPASLLKRSSVPPEESSSPICQRLQLHIKTCSSQDCSAGVMRQSKGARQYSHTETLPKTPGWFRHHTQRCGQKIQNESSKKLCEAKPRRTNLGGTVSHFSPKTSKGPMSPAAISVDNLGKVDNQRNSVERRCPGLTT